jgi:hypothetical protein
MPRGNVQLNLHIPNLSFTDAIGKGLANLGHGYGVLGQATEAVGAAFSHAGQVADKSGTELFNRAVALQEITNETATNEAVAGYDVADGKAQADFLSTKGTNASGQFAQFSKDAQERRNKFRDTLANDSQKRLFDNKTMNMMGRTIREGARHAGVEQKNAYISSLDSNVATKFREVSDHPFDDDLYNSSLPELRELIEKKHQALGHYGDEAKNEYTEVTQKLLADRLTHQSLEQPNQAWDNYQKAKEFMPEAMRDQVEHTLMDRIKDSATLGAHDKVMKDYLSGAPDESKTIQERVDAGVKELPQVIKDHPEQLRKAEKELRQRIEGSVRDYQQQRSINVYNHRNDTYRILNAEKPPLKLEDFLAIPEGKRIYEASNDIERAQIKELIYTMANREFRVDAVTSQKNREKYLTQFLTNRDEFMKSMEDMRSVMGGMNGSDRRTILNLYEKVLKSPAADPDVAKGMSWLKQQFGPQMRELGVYDSPRRGEATEDWDHLHNGVYEAIQDWRAKHKGAMPSQEEFNKNIAPTILKDIKGTTWPFSYLPWATPDQPAYWKVPMQSEWEEKERAKIQAETGTPAADIPQEDINKRWIRYQYQLAIKPKPTAQPHPSQGLRKRAAPVPAGE